MNESEKDNDALPAPRLPAEIIERILNNQEQELQLRGKELENRGKEIDHNAEFSRAALDAQVLDRDNHRKAYNVFHKRNIRFFVLVILCVTALALSLIAFDKESILLELIKLVVVSAGSLGFGYHWGRSTERKSQQGQEMNT